MLSSRIKECRADLYRLKQFLRDIRFTSGHADVYYIQEQSHITDGGTCMDIKPLMVVLWTTDPKRGRWVYRKELLELLQQNNPRCLDVRITLNKKLVKSLKPGINILRVSWGRCYHPTLHCEKECTNRVITQQYPDPKFAQVLVAKYAKMNELSRSDVYKLNSIARNNIRLQAAKTIQKFARAALAR